MANGDIAAAAGLPVVSPTADIRLGYDEINLTRDEVATHMTTGTHIQDKIVGLVAALAAKANDAATTDALATKSPVGHTHDDRYYTETEVHAIEAILYAAIAETEAALRASLLGQIPSTASRYIRYDEGTGHLVYGGSGVSEHEIAWTS